ncbi:MAG: ABC transporter permease [Clostridiaceae bacterium]|nr:ABC transporter permease [Clostridiaceae bacterium]
MTPFFSLVKRNTKLFFKDKGMFFTSLITPVILLVLYATFLAGVYRDSFASAIPDFLKIDGKLLDGAVSAQLISSLLAVSCVTVAFCSNLLMVQDKISGARQDLCVSPVRRSSLAAAYFVSSSLSTLIITFTALGVCLLYQLKKGWYFSGKDVALLFLDVFLLTLFGVAVSSCVNFFLSTNGQGSAVGTIVSAGYGFVCGAYMPISSFAPGLQKVLSFFPGTYATSLIRNHAMRGAFAEMESLGFPDEAMKGIRDAFDCNLYFFEKSVSVGAMYAVLCASITALLLIYIIFNILSKRKLSD